MRTLAALLLTLSLIAGVASATIRPVGLYQTYTTLAAAYTAAVNGDTIMIMPGVYNETISPTKRLHWIGAGMDRTIWGGGGLGFQVGSSGSTAEGITFQVAGSNAGPIGIVAGVDLITVKRCRLHNTYSGMSSAYSIYRTAGPGGTVLITDCILSGVDDEYYAVVLNGDNITIQGCVFVNTASAAAVSAAVSGSTGSVNIQNCVFLGMRTLFYVSSSPAFSFRNNILYDWISNPSFGTYPPTAVFDYNASSSITPPGTNATLLTVDPFVNYEEALNFQYGVSNLHLDPVNGNDCIDAGDPAIFDLDGSQSDMGIYGGPQPYVEHGAPNYPFAIDFDVPPSITAGQTLPVTATGRIGRGN